MCQLLTCWLRSDLILTLIPADFIGKCMEWRALLAAHLKILKEEAHEGELAAFASYAIAFPDGFLALVDTYDVTRYIRCLIQGCKMGIAKSLDYMISLEIGLPGKFVFSGKFFLITLVHVTDFMDIWTSWEI